MACPDELTLDLWLADALPSDEAASVAAHVGTCQACTAATRSSSAFAAEVHAALALEDEELQYLAGLELPRVWQRTAAPALSWGWIALASVVAGFFAWLVAAPLVGPAIGVAVQIGLLTITLNAVLGLIFGFGQGLLELIQSPALGWNQPLLALLALALLFWPRQRIPQRSTRS